jgi:predicted GNAT family N-acyltransferase
MELDEQTGVVSPQQSLDSQDLSELLKLVAKAFAHEAVGNVQVHPLPVTAADNRRPTNRMVALKQLELKLIRLKHAVHVLEQQSKEEDLGS